MTALDPHALDALKNNQRQLDMDGCEIGVSRQALDELIAAYETDAPLARASPSQVAPANPAQVTDAGEALKPFTTFAAEAIERSDALWVWKSNIFRDRVCDWFGPSDFGTLLHFSEALATAISAAPTDAVTNAAASIAAMVAEWYDSAPHAPHIPAEIIAKRLSRFAAIGAGGHAAASIDDVAARMWKADAEDSGTPASVAAGRTREAFDNQTEELKTRWRKFAKAASSALSQPHPADERVMEALDEGLSILTNLSDNIKRHGNYSAESTCLFIEQAGAEIRSACAALSAKEGRKHG